MSRVSRRVMIGLGWCVLALAAGRPVQADPCVLVEPGRKPLAVVTAPQATAAVGEAAAVLADYLGRCAAVTFSVEQRDRAEAGIIVGLVGDFADLDLGDLLRDPSPAGREQYLLRSSHGRLLVLGATELALRHAVWDLLYRLGHRQFFPGEVWEVLPPAQSRLAIDIDEAPRPAYLSRMIWVGFGGWDYNDEPLAQWYQRNRTVSDFTLRSGHAYDNIIRKNRAAFEAHPEYRGLYKGQRRSSKFCIGNPAVRALVRQFALDYFAQRPDEDSISVDPSDGGGWCECEACAAIGSPSDRAVTVANEVAAALDQHHPEKFVGMYAYNEHAPPPRTVRPTPRLIVCVATAFLRGQTVEQLIAGWQQAGVQQFGIREYFSVNTWDRDLPGRARGSRLAYIADTISRYHQLGARFYSSESGDNWGPCGLGYYVAARILWDPAQAQRVEELKADFLEKAFGPVQSSMGRFYDLIDGDKPVLLSPDLVGRMYRVLDEARRGTSDPAILARLDHLLLYTRYVELFRLYDTSSGQERQQQFEQLIRHVYRMRATMMVHAKALYRDLDKRDKSVSIPQDCGWQIPEGKNPWKDSRPWSAQELSALLASGIEANAVTGFEPAAYSMNLRPLPGEVGADQPVLEDSVRTRGRVRYYTWAPGPNTSLRLQVTAGLVAHYRDRGPAHIEVTQIDGDLQEPVAQAQVEPTGEMKVVELTLPDAGLYCIQVQDGMDSTSVVFPADLPRSTEASPAATMNQVGRRSGYFYVPRGTKVIGGHVSSAGGSLHDPQGKLVLAFERGNSDFEVHVPSGMDGQCWSIRQQPGALRLLTVPPYLAAHPRLLLVPQECLSQETTR